MITLTTPKVNAMITLMTLGALFMVTLVPLCITGFATPVTLRRVCVSDYLFHR